MQNTVDSFLKVLKNSNKLLITAGAGMGCDSGMPDFRGNQGFWKTFPAFENKFSFSQCANPQFLKDHPQYFWAFYGYRINLYNSIQPHQGFQILQNISKYLGKILIKEEYFIVTSNVDGHFQKSGFPEEKIYEIHGRINFLQCNSCQKLIESNQYTYDVQNNILNELPKCPRCLNVLRPNILLFNDQFYMENYDQQYNFRQFLDNLKPNDKLLVIELGAGTAVPTIRNISESFLGFKTKPQSATLFRINKYECFISKNLEPDDIFLGSQESALFTLQQIQKLLN